jgi:acyl carrier protein
MNSLFTKLKSVLHNKFCFHLDQIQMETNLELELGMDSREFFELLYEIEKIFEITIDFDEIDDLIKNGKSLTINDIVEYIQEKQFLGY